MRGAQKKRFFSSCSHDTQLRAPCAARRTSSLHAAADASTPPLLIQHPPIAACKSRRMRLAGGSAQGRLHHRIATSAIAAESGAAGMGRATERHQTTQILAKSMDAAPRLRTRVRSGISVALECIHNAAVIESGADDSSLVRILSRLEESSRHRTVVRRSHDATPRSAAPRLSDSASCCSHSHGAFLSSCCLMQLFSLIVTANQMSTVQRHPQYAAVCSTMRNIC